MFVRPELVVEIALDGVQASRRYPGGVALRFARVRRYRPDKTAATPTRSTPCRRCCRDEPRPTLEGDAPGSTGPAHLAHLNLTRREPAVYRVVNVGESGEGYECRHRAESCSHTNAISRRCTGPSTPHDRPRAAAEWGSQSSCCSRPSHSSSAGVAIGVLRRNGAVDHQTRRAFRAEEQLSSLRDRLARNQAKIDDQAQQLTRARQQLEQAQTPSTQPQLPAPGAATSFGDGLYQVGLAIQPGSYHTNGAADCYWAKLSTGDTNKVIVNNVGAGPQTVTIDSPYFESEACGSWTKVG